MIDIGIYNTIFNEMPIIAFVVDEDVRVKATNLEAKKVIDSSLGIYDKRGGEVLKCVNSTTHASGCGHSLECKNCIIRNSIGKAKEGSKTFRQQSVLKFKKATGDILFHALITSTPFSYNEENLFLLMIENVTELMALKNLIPICSLCKKIRDDDDYWTSVEVYFNTYISVDFTHSLCPECIVELYPELNRNKVKQAVIQSE